MGDKRQESNSDMYDLTSALKEQVQEQLEEEQTQEQYLTDYYGSASDIDEEVAGSMYIVL